MTTGQTLLIVGGGALLYSLLSKASAAGNLIFTPDRIHSLDFSGISPIIKAYIRVQNTSSESLRINSIAGNVLVNKDQIGTIENFVPVAIPGNNVALLPLTFRLSWIGVVQDIIKAMDGGAFKQNIDLDAYINIQGLPLAHVPLKFSAP